MKYLMLILGVLGLDQLFKFLVVTNLEPYEPLQLIGFLHLNYVKNTGAAFSLFDNGYIILSLFSAAVLVALAFCWSKPWLVPYRLPLSLAVGGALGNLVDRVFRHYVVDYIDLTFWPVFNFADAALVCGLGFLMISVWRSEGKDKKRGADPIEPEGPEN